MPGIRSSTRNWSFEADTPSMKIPPSTTCLLIAETSAPTINAGQIVCGAPGTCLPGGGSLIGAAVRAANLSSLPRGGDPRTELEESLPGKFPSALCADLYVGDPTPDRPGDGRRNPLCRLEDHQGLSIDRSQSLPGECRRGLSQTWFPRRLYARIQTPTVLDVRTATTPTSRWSQMAVGPTTTGCSST